MKKPDGDEQGRLREEFNRWAEEGGGEEMEEHHLPIVEPTLALMNLQPLDRVLDVGCGTGWLGKRLAALVPKGQVVGIDVSDEMVRRAQQAGAGFGNLTFLRGSADRIPWESDFFTKVISVESPTTGPIPQADCAKSSAFSRPAVRHGFSSTIIGTIRTVTSGAPSTTYRPICSPPANGLASLAMRVSRTWRTVAFPIIPRRRRFTPAAGSGMRSRCGNSNAKGRC